MTKMNQVRSEGPGATQGKAQAQTPFPGRTKTNRHTDKQPPLMLDTIQEWGLVPNTQDTLSQK